MTADIEQPSGGENFDIHGTDGITYRLPLSPLRAEALDQLPNWVTCKRPLSASEDIMRAGVRSILHTLPFLRKSLPSQDIQRSPAYRENELLWLARQFVDGLVRVLGKEPVRAVVRHEMDANIVLLDWERPGISVAESGKGDAS